MTPGKNRGFFRLGVLQKSTNRSRVINIPYTVSDFLAAARASSQNGGTRFPSGPSSNDMGKTERILAKLRPLLVEQPPRQTTDSAMGTLFVVDLYPVIRRIPRLPADELNHREFPGFAGGYLPLRPPRVRARMVGSPDKGCPEVRNIEGCRHKGDHRAAHERKKVNASAGKQTAMVSLDDGST